MRVVRLLVITLSVVLAVLGLIGAAYVGPDDTVRLETQELDARPGEPVVVSTDITGYRDLRLSLEVEGEATVGTMHPVDAASLVEDTAHYEVTGVRRDRLLGVHHDGDPLPADVPADLWLDRVEADPDTTFDLDLDGQPVQAVVVPTGTGVPMLGFGIRLPGLFWLLLAVGVLGLLLVVLTVWRSRRAGAVAVLPAMLVAAGCGWVPDQATGGEGPARVSVTDETAQALLDDYDRRNNRAIEQTGPPRYDPEPWKRADTGALLEADLYDTGLDEVTKAKNGRPHTHEVRATYPMSFTRYPLLAAFELETTTTQDSGDGGKQAAQEPDTREVGVFVRGAATDPWRLAARVGIGDDDLPSPRDAATSASATPRLDGLRRLSSQVERWLDTGRPAGLDVARTATTARDGMTDTPDNAARVELDVFDWDRTEPTAYVIPVEGGHLALLHHELRQVWVAPAGQTLHWNPGYDQLNGDMGDDLYIPVATTTAVLVPEEGSPRVVGLAVDEVVK